jgi:DNA-binding NtrC family response regulator
MRPETLLLPLQTICYEAVRCPAQVLVIDRVQGPADLLVSTISVLLGREVSVTLVDDHMDALRALNCCSFDLVVVGLEHDQPLQLAVLPHIHSQHSELPVLVVGRHVPHHHMHYARRYGASDVWNLPERAADLKLLVADMAHGYLQPVF